MQIQNNVIKFPNKLTNEVGHKKPEVGSSLGAGHRHKQRNQKCLIRTTHCRRELMLKGGLEMPRQQSSSAVKIIKTFAKAGKRTTKARAGTGVPARDKNEKFKQLAMKRIPRVLHELKLIENLASNNYKYTREQADKIIRTIEDGVQKVKDAFNRPARVEPAVTFEL